MMRSLCSLIVFIVWYSSSFGQGKFPYTVSNGVHLAGVDETNPVIYDNDLIVDTPDIFYLWLKAHRGEVRLVGNINTRDMYNQPNYQYSHDDTFVQWVDLYNKAQQTNLQNIPAPVKGTSIALVRPASGVIEQTQYSSSVGSDLIITEARKASPQKPLVIFVGGNVSSIANAYLKDNSIADKVVVLHVAGYRYNSATYNTTDFWSSYIVMKRFRYVNWAGNEYGYYNGHKPIPVDLTGMPNNPFTSSIRSWYNNGYAIYQDVSDSPVVVYFFNHALWGNVVRKLENDQTTTSDTYDYLLVADNDFPGYGSMIGSYLRDPANYTSGPANTLPAVSLTAPADNSNFAAGASVTITATASDPDGSITRVEFFNGTSKIGEDLSSPYSFTWNNLQAGTYSLHARATDNQGGAKNSTAVSITVTSANSPPSVALTAPADNASFAAGASVTISANASDTDGSVAKVEFYNGNTKLGEDSTSPYSFVWTNIPAGTHSITARATDNQNSTTTSNAKVINVIANALPVVSLTAPANNTSFPAGASITLTATASDDGSVSKVEFYNGATKLGEDTSSPYSFTWPNVPAGTYILTAKATDNKNATKTSSPSTINVIAGNAPPAVTLTAPGDNASFTAGSSIILTANASDGDGTISKVEFFSGAVKLGEDATSPYSFTWNNVIAGSYELTARATDNKNATNTSAKVRISVNAVNTPPTVTITSPAGNSIFPAGTVVTLKADASDANGNVVRVEFFNGTAKLGEDVSSPYTFTWNDIPAGSYAITAKGTDNQNTTTTSEPVTFTIMSTVNPTANAGEDVFLTLPENSVTLNGVGISADGSSLKYSWAQISGPGTVVIANPAAQKLDLDDLAEGSYVLELTVTDAKGLTGHDQVKVTVAADLIVQSAIPRFFTPNGDGINDFWEWPQTELFEKSILMIFDRFGRKVYESVNYNNTWDGRSEGKPLSDDAYYYVIRLLTGDDIRGAVRIVR